MSKLKWKQNQNNRNNKFYDDYINKQFNLFLKKHVEAINGK